MIRYSQSKLCPKRKVDFATYHNMLSMLMAGVAYARYTATLAFVHTWEVAPDVVNLKATNSLEAACKVLGAVINNECRSLVRRQSKVKTWSSSSPEGLSYYTRTSDLSPVFCINLAVPDTGSCPSITFSVVDEGITCTIPCLRT